MIEAEGRRLYHSGDSLAYPGLVERLGTDPFDVLFLPINGRDPARGVPGNMTAAEAVDLAALKSARGSSCRIITTCLLSIQYPSRCSQPRRAGFPRGSSRAFCRAESAGRSCREYHAGNRHRHVRDQDDRDRREGDDPGLGVGRVSVRPSAAGLVRARSGPVVGRDQGNGPAGHGLGPVPAEATSLGVGLSGQMHGSVFLDAAGEVIRPALLWNDQRTAAECQEIETKAGGREALIRLVANPALTGFTAPKLLWVRKHEPQHWERVRQVLLPKDYVRYRLTGTFATEVSDASGTLLLDVANRRWSRELLGKLDIDPALLPACHESQEVSAQVSELGSKATGLPVGTPVVGGGGDQPAGAVGNGIVRQGVVSATMGTSGVVFAHADSLGFDPAGQAAARLPCRARRLARHGRRAVGGWQLSVVPQRAGQGRGRDGQEEGRRPLLPANRRGRAGRARGGGAFLPPLPDRRANAAFRPRRQGGLGRA